ncbi:hypothetical protein BFP72_08995 [Reichenbachiella sp. 5M10]|uniref:hypothetical protein n=1 Tax=Reichenbachiella sp. 5M10 TaxID=1889772 RepID=UPI000C15D943|nr:hypothetical protein [Reichenbachiella sp. 5M10]PIB35516.1 hypothetical protein BFP72_08995 [Reichenbachiella sp. 5M10]
MKGTHYRTQLILMGFCCIFILNVAVPQWLEMEQDVLIENNDVEETESEEKNEEVKGKMHAEELFCMHLDFSNFFLLSNDYMSRYLFLLCEGSIAVAKLPPDVMLCLVL